MTEEQAIKYMRNLFIVGQIDNADFKGAAGLSLDSDTTMKPGLDQKKIAAWACAGARPAIYRNAGP